MRVLTHLVPGFFLLISFAWGKSLDIYVIDVEGGQATLFVAPSGQSLLVDAGYPGFSGRDANRIVQATRMAHVKRIDYLVVTHYHRDHVGGVPALADRIPIGTFVDHGALMEDSAEIRGYYADYEKTLALARKHMVVKPGDEIPMKDLKVQVVSSAGEVITSPLAGAGQANSYCGSTGKKSADPSENARSVGILVTYGRFRLLDLGDLTWNKELELMCPSNRIGSVDVYLASHHGLALSGSPALVDAIRPRVAVIANGPRKGAAPSAWQIIKESPGLEDIWQLHYALANDPEHNAAESFIANVKEQCEGRYLRVEAAGDGSFTVQNSRTGFQKKYASIAK